LHHPSLCALQLVVVVVVVVVVVDDAVRCKGVVRYGSCGQTKQAQQKSKRTTTTTLTTTAAAASVVVDCCLLADVMMAATVNKQVVAGRCSVFSRLFACFCFFS